MSNALTTNLTKPDAVGAAANAAIAAAAPPPPPPRASAPKAEPAAQRNEPIDAAKFTATARSERPMAEKIDDSDDDFDAHVGLKKPDPKPKTEDQAGDEGEVHIEDTPASDENPFAIPAKKDEPKPAEADPEPPKPGDKHAEPNAHRSRDYSKFHPDDAAILKKLPNELYAKYSVELPKLREQAKKAAELEAKLTETAKGPQYLHEHPEAVVLTPEYRTAVNDLQQTEFEAQHYREQLLKIRRGESWKTIDGWTKEGQPVYGAERKAPEGNTIDLEADVAVSGAYNKLLRDADGLKTQLSSLVSSHSTRAQRVVEEVRTSTRKLFPDIELDKLEGEDKQVAEIIKKAIHPAFANHPQSEPLIYAGVQITRMRRMLLETQEKLRKAEAALGVKQLAPAAAPTVGSGGKVTKPAGEMVNTKELFGDD